MHFCTELVFLMCRQDYIANEVTLDYNAGFQGAVGKVVFFVMLCNVMNNMGEHRYLTF
jgi:hypothetical protein